MSAWLVVAKNRVSRFTGYIYTVQYFYTDCWSSSLLYKHNVSEVGCLTENMTVTREAITLLVYYYNYILHRFYLHVHKQTITLMSKCIQIRDFIVNCHRLCCVATREWFLRCKSTTKKAQEILTSALTLLHYILVFNFNRKGYYFEGRLKTNFWISKIRMFVVYFLVFP